MDERMRNLDNRHVEIYELWGFIGKKKENVTAADPPELGDVWTFIALDSATKVVPCFPVGKRDIVTAHAFVGDLASRMKNRIQLSADAFNAYVGAVAVGFGRDAADFVQIVKTYSAPSTSKAASSRYSPGSVLQVTKACVFGSPIAKNDCTSYVERHNLTLRMHCRRLTRLTNAFSKRLENFKAAVALNFAYCNFVLRHATLRMTPAMPAGVANDYWTVADLIDAA